MLAQTVLIVDDSQVNLKLTEILLSKEGFRVQTARNAEEALGVLNSHLPDLMLVDLQLPGIDGLELTRWVKADARTRDIVVIAVTASTAPQDRAAATAAGCAAYVTKPIDTRTLGQTIRAYAERRADESSNSPLLTGALSLSGPEWESLRRRFLEEGVQQSRGMLARAGGSLDPEAAVRVLHRWVGAAGALGYLAISDSARAAMDLLQTAPLDPAVPQALARLLSAFTEPREAAIDPMPDSIARFLSGKRIALVGFAVADEERLCTAMERIGARPALFSPVEATDSPALRDCCLAMVQVTLQTLSSPWLAGGSSGPRVPLLLVGSREKIMALDTETHARAREFLIDGWQPEEALMRCAFALMRSGAAPASAAPRAERSLSGPPDIVIADDDPIMRSLVRGALETYGMDCRVASSGAEALDLVRAQPPHAAVLDVNMPEMDGYLALAAMREEGYSFPIILLTARRHEHDITRGFNLGADDYVLKPFNNVELVARLRRLLRR